MIGTARLAPRPDRALAIALAAAFKRERRGATAIEFALLAPVLLVLLVGVMEFGIALNNYIILNEATRSAARQLALGRGAGTPYTNTINQVYQAAPTLSRGRLTITLSVNGTACASNSSCSSALTNGQGEPVTVALSYPCRLVVMGYDFAPSCTLSSTVTEMVE